MRKNLLVIGFEYQWRDDAQRSAAATRGIKQLIDTASQKTDVCV